MTPDEEQRIIDDAVERETRRCEAIYTSTRPGPLQDLASYLAFETNVPADLALAILNVARFLNVDLVNAEIAHQSLAELAAHIDQTLSPKKETSNV